MSSNMLDYCLESFKKSILWSEYDNGSTITVTMKELSTYYIFAVTLLLLEYLDHKSDLLKDSRQ